MPFEIIKLLLVIILIIFLLKLKINLGINLLINSLLLGILFRIEIMQIFHIWKNATINPKTLELISIVFLVYLLNIILEKLKMFYGMVKSLQRMIKDYRLVMIFISSFVALLPIQGGAIFSAPMIRKMGTVNNVTPESNMFINYWFRHTWNIMWPLYPSFIIYSSLIEIPLVNLALILLPFAIVTILTGTIWVYKNLNSPSVYMKTYNKIVVLLKFLNNTWPILSVIIITLFFNINLLFSLLFVIIILFIFNLGLGNQVVHFLFESFKRSNSTLLMILGIFFFKGVLEYSQVVEYLPHYFLTLGIPIDGVLGLVPFLVGILTGSMTAIVGICVPVLLAFLTVNKSIMIGRIVLLYIAGFIGMMCTPIHLCLAITKDYFKIKISNFYHILVVHLTILSIFLLIYYIFLESSPYSSVNSLVF